MAEVKDKLITLESFKSAFDHLVTLINGKAASSHGNHVPATQTANNAKFLRNDNTWQTVTPANIGAAASSHGTHVSYSSTAPVMDGTASAGSASTVARSDHKHPTDTSRLSTSNVLNNVTTTNSGYALDARQGKALQDQITQLNSNLTELDNRFIRRWYKESSYSFSLSTGMAIVFTSDENLYGVIKTSSSYTIFHIGGTENSIYAINGNTSTNKVTITRNDGGSIAFSAILL